MVTTAAIAPGTVPPWSAVHSPAVATARRYTRSTGPVLRSTSSTGGGWGGGLCWGSLKADVGGTVDRSAAVGVTQAKLEAVSVTAAPSKLA